MTSIEVMEPFCCQVNVMKKDGTSDLKVFSSLNYLNILPCIHGKRVVICGFENNELSAEAIRQYGASVVSIKCLFADHDDKNNSIIESENDFFILSAEGLIAERASTNNLKKVLQLIYDSLNCRGILLVIIPPGKRLFPKKILFKIVLLFSGYKNVRSYVSVPTSRDQSNIFPISDDRALTLKLLTVDMFGKGTRICFSKNNIKNIIKYVCAKWFNDLNPFTGLMVVASKSEKFEAVASAEELYRDNVPECDEGCTLYTAWVARATKHIGLIYSVDNENELLAVCKRTLASVNRSSCLREEYEKLQLLSKHHAEFQTKKIHIPTPVCFESRGGEVIAIETAVKGAALEGFKWRLSSEKLFDAFTARLDELVNLQMTLQETISDNLNNNFPNLSKKYFVNTLNVSDSWFDNTRRLDSYSAYVQHGDFTDVNIIYDTDGEMWGVIDWEWSASGFPLLFDLFYLFTSLEFRCEKEPNEYLYDHYYSSFVDTYFTENYFSKYIKLSVLKYCQKFDLEAADVFGYFLDFLLFQYNKFKYDYDDSGYDYLIMYEKFIQYSIGNRDKFIVDN
jgi:hypothetical protein